MVAGVNVKDTRRGIADKLIADNVYKLQILDILN
jgi:hypothetical protein